jgi:hypothetical protein
MATTVMLKEPEQSFHSLTAFLHHMEVDSRAKTPQGTSLKKHIVLMQ